jgi:glycosyltransferase involved in cell wall biosynthesis
MRPINMFLTISIPTYNRSEKLHKLLDGLLEAIKNSIHKDKVGVFVSNNASTDNTENVLSSFKKKYHAAGVEFFFLSQKVNIGASANVVEALLEPVSQYVWWFSDHDQILAEYFDKFIDELVKYTPDACNIGYLQPPYTVETPRYNELDHGFFNDVSRAHEVMSTKLTSVVVRKQAIELIDKEELSRSNWPHVLIFLPIILTGKKYYIFSYNLAKSEESYLDIRYPPSAFYELSMEKKKVYLKYNIPQVFKNRQIKITRFSVNINFLLLILTGQSLPPNNIRRIIYSELVYDFFLGFGFVKWVNIRALLSFIKRYLSFKLIGLVKWIKRDWL